MKILKYITLILLAFTACASTIQVKHDISYDKKGTRSERRNGELFVNGVQIPPVFESVTVDDKSFVLITRPHAFGDHGYFPSPDRIPSESSADTITKDQLEIGYYTGIKRYKNTPQNWFQVKWDSTGAFIDSARIKEVMSMEPFKSLPDKTRGALLKIRK